MVSLFVAVFSALFSKQLAKYIGVERITEKQLELHILSLFSCFYVQGEVSMVMSSKMAWDLYFITLHLQGCAELQDNMQDLMDQSITGTSHREVRDGSSSTQQVMKIDLSLVYICRLMSFFPLLSEKMV